MPRYASADHPITTECEWNPSLGAERINDFILMSRGTSNGYVITNDAGDVVINTGGAQQGPRYRERYEEMLGRPLKVAKIVLTQDHSDHSGGWSCFADPGSETLVQRRFEALLAERAMLGDFYNPRAARVLHGFGTAAASSRTFEPPRTQAPMLWAPAPKDPTQFDDRFDFDVGGRKFELISASSGEALDGILVWLPAERVLFTGNWMGALYGAFPHFYTLRGDRARTFAGFMRELEHVIGLAPELLITGHGSPIRGEARIRADLEKLLAAIRFIHDETVKGMNAQKDLWTLMREVKLPDHLTMAPGRGPISWYVRAVYEEYAGWFRHEATTELYGVPPKAIWSRLAEMAGGPEALAQRAQQHLAAGEPIHALHFIEIALAADPSSQATRTAEIAVLEQLIELTEGKTFDELGWLETKLREAQTVLYS